MRPVSLSEVGTWPWIRPSSFQGVTPWRTSTHLPTGRRLRRVERSSRAHGGGDARREGPVRLVSLSAHDRAPLFSQQLEDLCQLWTPGQQGPGTDAPYAFLAWSTLRTPAGRNPTRGDRPAATTRCRAFPAPMIAYHGVAGVGRAVGHSPPGRPRGHRALCAGLRYPGSRPGKRKGPAPESAAAKTRTVTSRISLTAP